MLLYQIKNNVEGVRCWQQIKSITSNDNLHTLWEILNQYFPSYNNCEIMKFIYICVRIFVYNFFSLYSN